MYLYLYLPICTVLCLVAQLCLTLCNPMDSSPPGSSVHRILQARILEWVAMPSSREPSNPGIKPRSLALQVDSLLSELPGKPKNTGVGSLSLLQGIFLTQESTGGLLHYRQILYLVSYQEAHLPTYLSTYLPIYLSINGMEKRRDCILNFLI